MATRKASGGWEGELKTGKGQLSLGSGAFEGPFTFGTRFGDDPGTNPEELIGAALAGCFSMALTAGLEKAGHQPKAVRCDAAVKIEKEGEGFAITGINLNVEAEVPGVDDSTFQQAVDETKRSCPVSKALAGTDIQVQADLRQ